jgi:hypothetical protein
VIASQLAFALLTAAGLACEAAVLVDVVVVSAAIATVVLNANAATPVKITDFIRYLLL